MKLTIKRCFLIILLAFLFQSENLFAQDSLYHLQISRISNPQKVKQVDSSSFFKYKLHNEKKLKARFAKIEEDFIISTSNDTIYFSEIKWIKLKMQISRFGKTAAIIGVSAGSYLSLATVPMAAMVFAIDGLLWPIIAPAATLSAAVIGFRTLSGRRYHTKKWELEATTLPN
jgi:hypothetical protein